MNCFDTWINAQHSDLISVTFLTLKVRNRKKISIFLDITIKKNFYIFKSLLLQVPSTQLMTGPREQLHYSKQQERLMEISSLANSHEYV